MARKKIVAGNWKMNMTPSQAVKLVEELKPLVVSDDVEELVNTGTLSPIMINALRPLKTVTDGRAKILPFESVSS